MGENCLADEKIVPLRYAARNGQELREQQAQRDEAYKTRAIRLSESGIVSECNYSVQSVFRQLQQKEARWQRWERPVK